MGSDLTQEAWRIITDAEVDENDGTKGTHVVVGFEHLQASVASVVAERDRLKAENERLRDKLSDIRTFARVCLDWPNGSTHLSRWEAERHLRTALNGDNNE